MSTRNRLLVSAGIAIAVVALLWSTFFWIGAAPAALLGTVAWIASGENRRRERFRQLALTGLGIGFIGGGLGVFLLIRITGWGTSEGWEDLQAIVGGMMGAFAGAVIGLVVGAIAGFLVGPEQRSGDHRQ